MVLNIHELLPLCGVRGTVLVLSEKHEQHVLKFSNNCSSTPNTVTVSVMTRVTCGQCHAAGVCHSVWTVV